MLGLYLSSAGDSADKIKGISKFGPKAFSKLLTKVMSTCNVDMATCGDYKQLEKVIKACEQHLTHEQFEQLNNSFKLVSNLDLDVEVKRPDSKSTEELRRITYEKLQFYSLI